MGTKGNLLVGAGVGAFVKFFYETDNKTAVIAGLAAFSLLSIVDDAARAS